MVEKVDVYSDKSNGSKIYAFDYLRVIALVMICLLYTSDAADE